MKTKHLIFTGVFVLVALPMLFGFVTPDLAAGRAGRHGRLLWGLFSLPTAQAQGDEQPYLAYREALKVIKDQYYGEPIDSKKSKELTYEAIRGMLYSLNDPFTSFLDPEEWAQMQQTTRGDFEGIGAVLEQIGEDVRVVRPIPDTPAYKAGVKAGDVVMKVGQYDSKSGEYKYTSTLGKNINEVVKMIKGPKGTRVSVELMRKGVNKPITINVVRDHIEPPVVQYWMEDKENKIGHIVLNEFNEKSDEQYEKAISKLEEQGMRALVFDLRYNPGGLLNVAVAMGSRFIQDGPVVQIQEKTGTRQYMNVMRGKHNHRAYPMVVLVNENSASASEIVAGAIKDRQAGTLVGEHTFGKGLVQTLLPLSDGSALRLTTAKYFTPLGNDISNKYDEEGRPIRNTGGVKPDVVVKQSPDWTDQDFEDKTHDTQLQKALEILRTKLASTKMTNR